MLVTELDSTCSLAIVLDGYFLQMFLPYLQEAHIDEGFEEDLALHLIDPHWKFNCDAILADNLDDLGLIFEFLAFVFNLGRRGQTRSYLRLHGVDHFEVGVLWFLETDAFGPVGQVSDLDGYFVILIDLDVLEDHFGRDDLEALGVDGLLLGHRVAPE
jgi:hypothetical protein